MSHRFWVQRGSLCFKVPDPFLDRTASSASMPKWHINPHSRRTPQILFLDLQERVVFLRLRYRLCSHIWWREGIDNSFTHFPYGHFVDLPQNCAIDGAAYWQFILLFSAFSTAILTHPLFFPQFDTISRPCSLSLYLREVRSQPYTLSLHK